MRAFEGVEEENVTRTIVANPTLKLVLPSLPIWIIYPSQVRIHHIFSPQTKQV